MAEVLALRKEFKMKKRLSETQIASACGSL